MTIDIHAHIVPPRFIDRATVEEHFPARVSRVSDGGLEIRFRAGEATRRLEPAIYDLSRRLQDMDRMGVKVQVVSPPPYLLFDWLEPDEAPGIIRMLNEDLIAETNKAEGRLVPMGHLPMRNPEAAVAEIRRGVRELGVRLFQIGTQVAGKDLDAAEFAPLFAEAEAQGVVLFIHPQMPQYPRMKEYYLINLIGNPLETHMAATRLILSGLFDRHPTLRVVLAHGGGTLPWGIQRLDHGWRVRPETRRFTEQPPSSYLNRLFFDSVTHGERNLEFLADRVGIGQVVLGSDYPFDMANADPVAEIRRSRLSPADQEAVLVENARRLGISNSQVTT